MGSEPKGFANEVVSSAGVTPKLDSGSNKLRRDGGHGNVDIYAESVEISRSDSAHVVMGELVRARANLRAIFGLFR
jgi:hypothetical protein